MDLVLDPRAMANNLIATGRQSSLALGLGVGRQISGRNPAANRFASVPASTLSVLA